MRAQTTINVSRDALDTIDDLARVSGISRSKLFDLAARSFVTWAKDLSPQHLRALVDARVNEPISGYVRKVSPEEIKRQQEENARLAIEASEQAIARSLGISLAALRQTPIGQLTKGPKRTGTK